jgi:hypothetical protein
VGLVHTLPRQPVSCLGTGHWLVDPLASEQNKGIVCACMLKHVLTCNSIVCVGVCLCVCVSGCVFSACMCVWQCYVVGRQEGCTLCGLTNTGFSHFKVYRFENTTKAQGSMKGLHRATLKGTHRENHKVTIVEQFVKLCCTCNTLKMLWSIAYSQLYLEEKQHLFLSLCVGQTTCCFIVICETQNKVYVYCYL